MSHEYVVPEREYFVSGEVATRFAESAELHEGWSELGLTGKRCAWCHQAFVGFPEGIPDHLCSGPADPADAREVEQEAQWQPPRLVEPW